MMYNSNKLVILFAVLLVQTVWARCICDPADTGCLDQCVNKVRDCIGECTDGVTKPCMKSCVELHWNGTSSNNTESVKIIKRHMPEEHRKSRPSIDLERAVFAILINSAQPDVLGALLPYLVSALGSVEPNANAGHARYTRTPSFLTNYPAQPTALPFALPPPGSIPGAMLPSAGALPKGIPPAGVLPPAGAFPPAGTLPKGVPPTGAFPPNGNPPNGIPPNAIPSGIPPNGAVPGIANGPVAPGSPTGLYPNAPASPSAVEVHTTVMSMVTVAPSSTWVPTNIFHLSHGEKSLTMQPWILCSMSLIALLTTFL